MHDADGISSRRRVKNPTCCAAGGISTQNIFVFFTVYLTGGASILQSPLFMAYHDGQPFNDNHLRPCPMLENPEKLREIISKTGAKSTDPESPESADHLCDKCVCYAKNWKPTADKLWSDSRRMKVKSSVGDP